MLTKEPEGSSVMKTPTCKQLRGDTTDYILNRHYKVCSIFIGIPTMTIPQAKSIMEEKCAPSTKEQTHGLFLYNLQSATSQPSSIVGTPQQQQGQPPHSRLQQGPHLPPSTPVLEVSAIQGHPTRQPNHSPRNQARF